MANSGPSEEELSNIISFLSTGKFDECISFMEKSTLKYKKPKTNIQDTSIFESKVILVEDYKDLGSWGEVGKLLSKNY